MSASPPLASSRREVGLEVRGAIGAMVAGTLVLLFLVFLGHRLITRSDEVQNQFHLRAAALADRLHLTLRAVRLPAGVSPETSVQEPEAFAAAAERAYGAALGIADEIDALHRRFASEGSFERSMARLARAVDGLQAMRTRFEGDRLGFAAAIANAETYAEIVALQMRRQHEIAQRSIAERQRSLIVVLEVAGVLVVLAVVIGTRHYVRRSLAAIDGILAIDERRGALLAESLATREAALREKEVLLKEVYHRVKNNLQVVSSLLNMQGREVKDPEALRLFEDSANRVRSMALVHEQLYRSEDLGKISCRQFVEELAARLAEAYGPASRRVSIETRTDGLELGLVAAVPSALILNELIANAYRHAFAPDAAGRVEVSMEGLPDGRARLGVRDDGLGLPPGFSPREASSLGMRIVVTLARQLGGELTWKNDPGAHFEVVFRPE